ncbi:FAD/NAD(P)-binding domain [Phytophthora cactorum]|nr:FAD/NAD(P)-binding domain [Phytophthora cactorum]
MRGVAMQISADTTSDDKESETTEKLKFDYLVLATGSTYSAKLQEVRDHIKKAEKVLVVGGGAVGCEVAAEIKAKYPSKLVTIVDANKQLSLATTCATILRVFECFAGEA